MAEPPGQPPSSGPSSHRLLVLDFLRGLVLSIVLVDHVDDVIIDHSFFTDWTLKGLGLSDAAEAFVFLSGFTFGWVYGRRLERDGFWSCQRRGVARAAQIYGAMLLTATLLAVLAWSVSKTRFVHSLPLIVTSPAMLREALTGTALLTEPVWGLSILAVYAAVLPFLPPLLALARWSWWAAATISLTLYACSQLVPALNAGDAVFNPLAWQVVMVSGMLFGQRAVMGRPPATAGPGITVLAAIVLAAGLAIVKLASSDTAPGYWLNVNVLYAPIASKTNLGPLRIVHFAAVACLAWRLVQAFPRLALRRWSQPFLWSGRHSLPLFCLGVGLSYAAGLASVLLPESVLALLFLAADALLIQFAAAWMLERFRASRSTR